MLVTTTKDLFEKQQTFYSTKDTLVDFIRQNERGPVQVFEQVNFFNRAFLDIEKINPEGFDESSIFKVADLFTRYVEKVTDFDLTDSTFIVTKNNASLSYHVIFDYALDAITLRSVVALFKALYPWSGIIDDVVYSTGRLFKCVGSYKPGMNSTASANPETYHIVIRPCGKRVPLAELSDEEVASSLISNLHGAKVISIVKITVLDDQIESFKTTRTLDGVEKTFTQKKLYNRNTGKYSVLDNAAEVNDVFSTEKIAYVETKSSVVKYEEYVDLNNYFNNYNLRLTSVGYLKVYDKDLNEITKGLDKLLLRCLLSRDISLKVKYDDYIALAGNIKNVTREEYRGYRQAASVLGKATSRSLRVCESAVINHIRQKLLDNGVPGELLAYSYCYHNTSKNPPKVGDAKSLYTLTGIEKKKEFLYLENERYKALSKSKRLPEFIEYPSWYFTENDYITKPSNTMFKLFINKNSRIKDHRKCSYVNPYSRNPQADDNELESEDEDEDDEEPMSTPVQVPTEEPSDEEN